VLPRQTDYFTKCRYSSGYCAGDILSSASASPPLDLPLRYCAPHHRHTLSGCDWDHSYWVGGHIIIIIGTSCGGRLGRHIPMPRPLTLHKIARQAYSTLSWPGLRLPMTFSGRLAIPPGRSATKAFSIRPSPNIPSNASLTCAPAGSGTAMALYTGARSGRPLRNGRCCKNSARPSRKPTVI
jgi:hypothetical protein